MHAFYSQNFSYVMVCQIKVIFVNNSARIICSLYFEKCVVFVMMGHFGPYIECWYKNTHSDRTLQVPVWCVSQKAHTLMGHTEPMTKSETSHPYSLIWRLPITVLCYWYYTPVNKKHCNGSDLRTKDTPEKCCYSLY